VKVLKPGTRDIVETDLAIISMFVRLASHYIPEFRAYKPTEMVHEFSEMLLNQLNLLREARTMERFRQFFAGDDFIRIPRIYPDYTTSCVITMEFVDGIKVSDLDALRAAHTNFAEVARRGFRFVMQQTLIDGFFHADPHPGNIFVLPGDVVCFIDFGMMGRLGQSVREDFVELIYHVIDRSPPRVTETLLRLTSAEGAVAVGDLERDVARFMDAYIGRPLREMDLSSLLTEILGALREHGLRVPPDLYAMLKAITQIESVAVDLAPEFDVVAEAEPFVRQVFMARFQPRRMAEDVATVGREIALLVRDAPAGLRELGRIVKGGGIRVGVHQEAMPEVLAASDRIANRLAFAFVVGAALVGSAIVAAAEIPPAWNGISVLGLGGFLVALVMSSWLLTSILRHGRL
jgi:ubiquinone biosynthesis protein